MINISDTDSEKMSASPGRMSYFSVCGFFGFSLV